MDDIGQKSGHLMLITPERVFYAGLLGRPRQRCSGAFNIYVSIEGGLWLTTADGCETHGEMVALLPNIRHTIASDYRSVLSVVIEPESVVPARSKISHGVSRGLKAKLSPAAFAPPIANCANITPATILQRRIRSSVPWRGPAAARTRSPRGARDSADRKILRRAGDGGQLRRRGGIVPVALPAFVQGGDRNIIPFVPAWKRARHLLHFANQDINLAHLAQDIGYPDSTHFQPLDPPLLWLEAARDLFGLARPGDL